MGSHRLVLSLGLLVGLLAAALAWSPGAVVAAPPVKGTYVALGDSYAAGPLIPAPEGPWGCLRSSNNYPKLVAQRLGLELRDATCSGADTKDMTGAQGVSPEPNPPQFDRLDRKVRAVTLQIGGNDIGFSGIAETCVRAAFEQTTCKSKYANDDGTDELQQRIDATAPKVAAVIAGIRERSPKAAIFVLGYSAIFRLGGPGVPASCPAMGVGEEDAQYLRGVQESLNGMIAAAAAAGGATYVDVYGPSAGKTACDLPVLRWVEPLVPVNAAAPIHPNLNGMLGMADEVEQAMRAAAVVSTDLELPAPVAPLVPAVPSPF
jgi:lysophospholipase L1-like esterase